MTGTTHLHIACTFDERMAMPAMAMLKSVKRYHQDHSVHVHLMHSAGLDAELSKIVTDLNEPHFQFTLYEASTDYGHLSSVKHYTKANFYRVDLMTKIRDAARCLYLDCDVIVTRNLMELYDGDLQGYVAAASTDYPFKYWFSDKNRKIPFQGRHYTPGQYASDVLALKSGKYLNSGVMVVDLPRWNTDRISEQIMDYCSANPGLAMVDQDGINAVLDGRYAEIDCRWNATVYMQSLYARSLKKPSQDWSRIIKLWANDPWVVHFTFESKPWEPSHYKTSYDDIFWDYIMGSSFAEPFMAQYCEKIRKQGFFKKFRIKAIPERYRLKTR